MINRPRILLLDDNRTWLETLKEYLRSKGFTVLSTPDAAKALNLLENYEFALVLCDYHMPDMDGLQFVRHAHHVRPEIGVLMISSEEEPVLVRKVMASGARGVLAKSVAPPVLLNKVRELVDLWHSLQASDRHAWQRLLPRPQKAG
jgi:CheY-like chemotaxis protein